MTYVQVGAQLDGTSDRPDSNLCKDIIYHIYVNHITDQSTGFWGFGVLGFRVRV